MMLRETFRSLDRVRIDRASGAIVWSDGWRTEDVAVQGSRIVGTREMSSRVAQRAGEIARGYRALGRRTGVAWHELICRAWRSRSGSTVHKITMSQAALSGGNPERLRAGSELATRGPSGTRATVLRELSRILLRDTEKLAVLMANEIGKPVRFARTEVVRSAEMLDAIATRFAMHERRRGSGMRTRQKTAAWNDCGDHAVEQPRLPGGGENRPGRHSRQHGRLEACAGSAAGVSMPGRVPCRSGLVQEAS